MKLLPSFYFDYLNETMGWTRDRMSIPEDVLTQYEGIASSKFDVICQADLDPLFFMATNAIATHRTAITAATITISIVLPSVDAP